MREWGVFFDGDCMYEDIEWVAEVEVRICATVCVLAVSSGGNQ